MNRILCLRVVCLLLALDAIMFQETLTAARASHRKRYTLGITDDMRHGPAMVLKAFRGGAWKNEGISVNVAVKSDDDALFGGLKHGFKQTGKRRVDFLICRAVDALNHMLEGVKIVPVAKVAIDKGRTKFVVKKDIGGLSDLKGKKVACELKCANLYFLSHVLKKDGLTLDDVTIVDLHGLNIPKSFIDNKVSAIVIDAEGAKECLTKGDGKITATSAECPGVFDEIICVKDYILKNNPEDVEKFIKGYLKGVKFFLDKNNEKRVVKFINAQLYFLHYRHDSKDIDINYIKDKLKDSKLILPESLKVGLKELNPQAAAFFDDWSRKSRRGLNKHTKPPLVKLRSDSVLDNAFGWWRFTQKNDYYNYGTAGSALDLVVKGDEQRSALFGIRSGDYYHRERVKFFGGFMNDGCGWAVDGVRKYLETKNAFEIKGDFTVWVRCSNRNTKSTVLMAMGKYDGKQGFSLIYNKGPKPWFSFRIHPAKNQSLDLKGAPIGTFVDVCFSYNHKSGAIQGWMFETKTGKLITRAKGSITPQALQYVSMPLTIGGNHNHNTNLPLHGNIENCAIWKSVLNEKEVYKLTNGPAKAAERNGQPADNWFNVKNFGAVGDGVHDDTEAIQRTIDSCVFPVDIKMRGSNRYWWKPDYPIKPGYGFGGVVYIPRGVYYTTRPILLRPNVTIIGDKATRPVIDSTAEAGMVFWRKNWYDRKIDFKVRAGFKMSCTGVTLENLWVKGQRFGAHTMGVSASRLRMKNCRWEGKEAGFVCTGFMMFSQIKDCQFESLWILCKQGSRFNTSIVENIVVGLQGTRRPDWAIRLEGCVQCVRLSEITFEARARGIFLNANAAGATIEIKNLWNYDTAGSCEVLRIINGNGISVSNVMAVDHPSTIFIGKRVRNISLNNILAKSITVEAPAITKPLFYNVPTKKYNVKGSLIEDDFGGVKKTLQ